MIKESEPSSVTLAIGDGANDVNMIQRAHVGIGIFGKEGYQAASNSDYAIGQFRYLRRLLFVHGRWSGYRLSMFMLLYFNKNIMYTLPEFYFGWSNGFSGQPYFDEVYMSAFNMFATNFAVCIFAVWEIDLICDPSHKDYKLVDLFMPQIYKETAQNELFTTKKFLAWSAVSVLQSLFMYGIPQITYEDYIFSNGKKQDFWAQGVSSYFAIVLLHYITVSFFTRNWNAWVVFWDLVSFGLFAPFQIMTYDTF
jgi:magnesium-transporting ATPase (P-type)